MLEITTHIAAALFAWIILGWHAHNTWTGHLRRAALVAMIIAPVSIFWTLWPYPNWIRALMAIIMFLFLGKTWELGVRKPSRTAKLDAPMDFLIWTICVPEGRWVASKDERKALRKMAAIRLARSTTKGAFLVGLLYLNQIVDMGAIFVLQMTWMGFITYLLFSGLWDAVAGLIALLGIEVSPMFNAPPLARNPRDFWGRRWNLWFTSSAHRLIFLPLGGQGRPLFAVCGVFFISAWLHEVIAILGLKTFDGRMLVFFTLHGIATIVFTMFDHRWRKPWPRPVAVGLHFIWMVATLQWFMGPADDMMNMSSWTLEATMNLLS